ncbi:hypothetical protein RMATCC62417_02149 [Rhizopus microsporus]|nr:hypothetical protein RMATCC62417_02149 [Rhizopus microsporus]
MAIQFPGKEDLDYFVLNAKKPTFEGFISEKQSLLATWSVHSNASSPITYFGLWKKRFLTSMTNLRPELNLKKPKFDLERWHALYGEIDTMRITRQIYRTESLRTLGAAASSSAQNVINTFDEDNFSLTSNNTYSADPISYINSDTYTDLTTSANPRAFVDSSTSVATAGKDSEAEADSMDLHTIFNKRAQGNQLSDQDINKLNSIIQSGGSDVKDKLASIASKTLLKQKWDATDDIIAKLSLSSICNLISPTTFDVLKDILGNEELLRLDNLPQPSYPGLSAENERLLKDLLESSDNVDDLLEKVYTNQRDLVAKGKRTSELYTALAMIHLVAENLENWKMIDSEMTVYRRLASLLDILFWRSSVDLVDGDCSSLSSKDAMILNQTDDSDIATSYGRKIDLMIITSTQSFRIELNSSEWKRHHASPTLVLKQQSKNLRTNASILAKLIRLADCDHVMAMDWIGTTGYMYILMNDNGIFVAKLMACLAIPTSFGQLKGFHKTLDSLFSWKVLIFN